MNVKSIVTNFIVLCVLILWTSVLHTTELNKNVCLSRGRVLQMLLLKIIFLTLCCVAYVELKEDPDHPDGPGLLDVLWSEVKGFKKILTGEDNETLQLLQAILAQDRNVDNSTDTAKKCSNCFPGYDLLKEIVIEPTFDLAKKVIGCADVILDVPKFKHDKCHSSWAAVMLSVMRDRICIWAGAPVKLKLTPQDIMDCCPNCQYQGKDLCENGGDPLAAWKFWIRFGVDLRGKVLFKKAAKKCANETEGKCEHIKCLIEVEGDVEKLKPVDIVGQSAYLLPNNMTHIQLDLLAHGPVQCIIQVYRDLFSYKSGIYRHKTGQFDGYHNVKLVGWGVDHPTKTLFWRVVNPLWGPKHGHHGKLKFLRGENHCEIESNCIGSLYKKSGKVEGKMDQGDKKKDGGKKKDGDKKKTKSSANVTSTNHSLFFILLITHILVGDMSYC